MEHLNLHIIILLFSILAAIKWCDWRNWEKYNSTMLFFSMGSLLYLYLYKNNPLWGLQRFVVNSTLTELLYAFIVLPSTAFLFLSRLPDNFWGQARRIIQYILIYSVMEFIYYQTGFINYKHGWYFWLSVGWNCMMFPMLLLHFRRPLYAYIISVLGLIIFSYFFPIPKM